MENQYPLFERNQILKKESLKSLRDYSFFQMQLEYQQYSNGILEGCDVSVRGDMLVVGKGIVKYNDFLYLLAEEVEIPYAAADRCECLKIQLDPESSSYDYIQYGYSIVLDQNLECGNNELEVCRFHLRSGAGLRTDYTCFEDMRTEYDTVNLLHAAWSGINGPAVAPAITRRFAVSIMEYAEADSMDMMFTLLCLNTAKTVSRKAVECYISKRLKTGMENMDNETIFAGLLKILNMVEKGEHYEEVPKKSRRRMIIVD